MAITYQVSLCVVNKNLYTLFALASQREQLLLVGYELACMRLRWRGKTIDEVVVVWSVNGDLARLGYVGETGLCPMNATSLIVLA